MDTSGVNNDRLQPLAASGSVQKNLIPVDRPTDTVDMNLNQHYTEALLDDSRLGAAQRQLQNFNEGEGTVPGVDPSYNAQVLRLLRNLTNEEGIERERNLRGDNAPSNPPDSVTDGTPEEVRQSVIKSLAGIYISLRGQTEDVDQARGAVMSYVEKSLGVPSSIFRNYADRVSKLKL